MGMFSSIRFAKKIRNRQAMRYSRGYQFEARKKKTDIEKFIDQRKEPYPNSWRYFVNRISWGVTRLATLSNENKIDLTSNETDIIQGVVRNYWDPNKNHLVIKGSKDMNFFEELTELIPDLDTFKLLYGNKNTWANRLMQVNLISPVSGSHWINEKFTEQYEVALPLIYNFRGKINEAQPRLINSQQKAVGNLEKVLVSPLGISNQDEWKFGKTYWIWVPAINTSKKFTALDKKGNEIVLETREFWRYKKDELI